MAIFYQPEILQGVDYLSQEESRHCLKVLRKRQGDSIIVTDGKGVFYDCILTKVDSNICEFLIDTCRVEPPRSFYIHIAIAPTKNPDRIEWFVEKSTELGVDKITLITCDNSERNIIKRARLEKVAVSAIKQSQKATLPIIEGPLPFKSILSAGENHRYIAVVDHNNPTHLFKYAPRESSYLVLIGPEGDFSEDECMSAIHMGFDKITLGATRLRTETAGLVACHLLSIKNLE